MLTVSQNQLVGALKATGSRDPDVLFAAKEATMAQQRQLKLIATVFMVLGGVLTASIIGAIVGVPMLGGAFWLRRVVSRNLEEADATLRSFMQHAA